MMIRKRNLSSGAASQTYYFAQASATLNNKYRRIPLKHLMTVMLLGVVCALSGLGFADANVTVTSAQPASSGVSQAIPAAGADYKDFMLRVGLTNPKTNYDKIDIGANGGVEIYNYQSGVETILLKAQTSGTLSFQKARVHLAIGTAYDSKDVAAACYDKVQSKFPAAFMGYDGGWRIYYGSYYSEGEAQAQSDLASLKASFPDLAISPESNLEGRVDLLDNGNLLFSYQSLSGEFFVKSQSGVGSKPPLITFQKNSYRGGIGARNNKGFGMVLINYLPVEDYLKSVIVDEMGKSWPNEAMKAQAVAARNYAMMNMNKHKTYGYDLCNTVDCQVYSGYVKESASSERAIAESRGIVMLYDGKPINAVYHSNSGGRTENVENVWGGKPIPYLVGVDDPFSANPKYPYTTWNTTMSFSEMETKLNAAGKSVGNLNMVQVSGYSGNGRAQSVIFAGTQGTVELKKEAVRMVFGTGKIRSTYFVVQSGDGSTSVASRGSGEAVTFSGRGNGHGLGMSQWGAKGMAEAGYTFDRILTTYYTGVKLDYADNIRK